MKAIFNNQLVNDLHLTIDDRGLQYGDGLFETILVEENEIKYLDLHFDRLKKGMQTLKMSVPEYFGIATFQSQISQLLEVSNLTNAVVNLQIWRKPGGRYAPVHQEVNFLIRIRKYFTSKNRILKKVNFSESIQNFPTPYSSFKSSNALKYVLAGIEQSEKAVDDLIIQDHEGYISETINKSIFWKTGDKYYTPSLDTGCIDGVMRKVVMKKCTQQGFVVQEIKANKSEILQADQVFACNVTGIYPIEEINGQTFRMIDSEIFD